MVQGSDEWLVCAFVYHTEKKVPYKRPARRTILVSIGEHNAKKNTTKAMCVCVWRRRIFPSLSCKLNNTADEFPRHAGRSPFCKIVYNLHCANDFRLYHFIFSLLFFCVQLLVSLNR